MGKVSRNKRLSVLLWVCWLFILPACQRVNPQDETYLAAADHIENGAYTAAETILRDLLETSPSPEPALALVDLYTVWQRPELGLQAVTTALERGIDASSVITAQLTLLMMEGQWEGAVQAAQEMLKKTPDNPLALRNLFEAHMQLHRCAEARETAELWQAANGVSLPRDVTIAILLDDPSTLCQEDAVLCEAVTGCEGTTCDAAVGNLLIQRNAWALASCVYERALEEDPDNASLHAWLGESLSRMGQFALASRHLYKAVELDPSLAVNWLLLGTHALQTGEWENARAALLNAQRLDPENPAICLAIAELKASQSLYNEVDTWTRAALERGGSDSEVWKAAARLYLSRNLHQSELPVWMASSAKALDPQDAEATMLLGWAYLSQNEVEKALTELDASLSLNPVSGEAHYLRGVALDLMDHREEAETAFIRAADLGYFP